MKLRTSGLAKSVNNCGPSFIDQLALGRDVIPTAQPWVIPGYEANEL